MKLTSKIALTAFASAVAGAALTLGMVAGVSAAQHRSGLQSFQLTSSDNPTAKGQLYTMSANPVTPPTDFTEAAESTINGVVSVKNYASPQQQQRGYNFIGPLEFFFGNPDPRQTPKRRDNKPQEQQRGSASGVIISPDGYIVTNNHVIDGADRLEITLNDNSTYNATIIGADANTDLALLKIDGKDLHFLPIGDSDALRVGEWVLAVGNPFGYTSTVTTGIISAKDRGILDPYTRAMGPECYIQTDAAVNPGNSGGALVNTKGELVGINVAIVSETGNYSGISFAIPTSIVTKVVSDLKQYGEVQRAMLGISYRELTPEIIKEKGIKGVNDGIYVASVEERSAAMEAGLEEDDVIIAINGKPTHTSAQLQGEMAKYRPGDKVTIDYMRDNQKRQTQVTFRNSLGTTAVKKASDFSALGCALNALTPEQLREYQIRGGVQVKGLTAGLFKTAGIKEGFIIQEINGNRMSSPNDVEQIYNTIMRSNDADKVMFISGMYPTGKRVYYAVPLASEED